MFITERIIHPYAIVERRLDSLAPALLTKRRAADFRQYAVTVLLALGEHQIRRRSERFAAALGRRLRPDFPPAVRSRRLRHQRLWGD